MSVFDQQTETEPGLSEIHHEEAMQTLGRGRRRAQTAFLGVLIVALLAAVAGAWYLGRASGLRVDRGEVSVEPSRVTTAVEAGPLVDTFTIRGEVVHAETLVLVATAPGRITALPVAAEIAEGSVVAEIDGTPIIALGGQRPMWREFGPDTRGADVEQFELAMQRLGFDPGTVDDRYTSATSAAWSALLEAKQYRATRTTVGMGEVVFIPGDVPVEVVDVPVAIGDFITVGGPLVEVASTPVVVRAQLTEDQRSLVAEGTDAVIVDESHDTEVGGVAQRVVGGDDGWMVEFSVEGDGLAVGTLVRVVVELARSEDSDVVVPSSALQTRPDGSIFVEIVDGAGTAMVDVSVTAASGGWVAVDAHLQVGAEIILPTHP